MMMWAALAQDVTQASQHLCFAKLQASSSSSAFPAISLQFTTLVEIFAYVTVVLIQPLR